MMTVMTEDEYLNNVKVNRFFFCFAFDIFVSHSDLTNIKHVLILAGINWLVCMMNIELITAANASDNCLLIKI